MPQEPGFMIDGKMYPVPTIDTFTFGELETLHGYCGLTINDWGRRFTPAGMEVWEKGVDTPGFQRALVHIAYRRGNAQVPDETVRDLVRDLVWLVVIAPLLEAETEPDPLPTTELTSGPERSSGNEPNDNEHLMRPENPISGTSSPTASGTDATEDATIGTSGLDTPSTSVPLRQVI